MECRETPFWPSQEIRLEVRRLGTGGARDAEHTPVVVVKLWRTQLPR